MTRRDSKPVANVVAEFVGDESSVRRAGESDSAEVHPRRGTLSSLLSMLLCCSKSSISNSIQFHAGRVDDSVHVMIKRGKEATRRTGQPEKDYTPRTPLSVRLAAARDLEADRQKQARTPKIEAREEDGESEMDKAILAAVSREDCVSAGIVR